MARPRTRRSASQILLYILSVVIILSMALGYALVAAPTQQPTPTLPPGTLVPQPTAGPIPAASPTATPEPTITPLPWGARPTADSSATEYTFAVMGDSRGNPQVFAALLKMVEEDGNDFLIHLGDLVDVGTPEEFQSWREIMAGFSLPFYTTPGNHDLHVGSLENYLAFTGAPGHHYSFDIGQAHFSVVDSSREYLTAEETAWLDADLAAAQKPVKIVAVHYPPFDPAGSDDIMSRGNEAFTMLMRQRGVNYVFAGHIHAHDQTIRDGVVYVISGGGGAPLERGEADGGFYHYVRVRVNGTDVQTEVRRLQ